MESEPSWVSFPIYVSNFAGGFQLPEAGSEGGPAQPPNPPTPVGAGLFRPGLFSVAVSGREISRGLKPAAAPPL